MRRHLIFFLAYSLLMVGSAFPDDSFTASDAVVLRSEVQKLEGQVTSNGLRVISTEKNEAFRLVTHALGREETAEVSDEGSVHPSEKLVRLERALLSEEYSVSTEGLRQDFLIHERPRGSGPLRLMLNIEGAACESIAEGVKLVLEGFGREIAYSKLKVTDDRGKEHTAMMHAASASMIEIVVADQGAAYPLRIDPTLSDADWVSLNNDILGVRGKVYCFVDDGAGNLYAGGRFTRIGGITTNHIARWDGTRWWPVGGGVDDGEFGWVDCLGFGGGNLYAGGNFSSAGGVPVDRIARWDGTTWHALGSGLTGSPQAIAVDGSNVFVGGSLTQAGGASVNSIARWDGLAWSAVGSGCNGQVNSLLFHNGLLYAGGAFTSAGGMAANRVAAWNGTTWSSLGIGLAGTVNRLLMFQGALVAGGDSGVESWNGSAWSILDAPAGSDLATDGTSLYFVSTSYQFPEVYRYIPGVSSEVIGTLINTFGLSGYPVFASFQGEIYVSGDAFREVHRYDETTGITTRTQVNNLARWNGAEWSPVSKNINNTVACMASENGQVVIGGNFTTAGGSNARRVALWNGTSWQALGIGLDKSVIAIAKQGADVYAAEIVEQSYFFQQATCRVQHWNGSSWQVLGGVFNDRIRAMHWHGGALYVAGSFGTVGENEIGMIARWSGTQWEQVGAGVPILLGAPARSMVSLGDDLYVGGYGVAKWNGQAWSMITGELDGEVYSLAVHEGQLLAGGDFTSIDAINFNGLARWNGTQWSAFPLWTGKDVIAMAVHGAELYLATQFLSVGHTEFPLQQWNGSAWKFSDMEFSQPGESVSFNVISSMAVASPGKLWVGGFFERVWRGTHDVRSPYLIQANIPGSTLSTQETWRQTHFGTFSNAGNNADSADFDLDGLPNLIEYAFGLNPTQGVSRALPVPQVNGSNYVLSFTRPVGVSGVTYVAEWSATLAPGSWVSIPNTGTAPQHTFSVPLSGNSQVFVRLKVTTP